MLSSRMAPRALGAAIALALATAATGLAPSTAKAGTIVFDTSGLVGSTGVAGTNVIKFVPVSQNSFSSPSTLSLGTFVVSALSDDQSTTYNHTPFAISFAISTVDGIYAATNPPMITLTGFLNGVVTGANKSTVVATFDPIVSPQIALGPKLTAFLSLPSPQRTLVPSTTAGGQSTAEAFVTVRITNTPEPGAMALLLAAGAGMGLMRLRRRAR